MGVIFPLSPAGRVVLVLIAVVLGLIFWMLWKPDLWKRWLKRKDEGVKGGKG